MNNVFNKVLLNRCNILNYMRKSNNIILMITGCFYKNEQIFFIFLDELKYIPKLLKENISFLEIAAPIINILLMSFQFPVHEVTKKKNKRIYK